MCLSKNLSGFVGFTMFATALANATETHPNLYEYPDPIGMTFPAFTCGTALTTELIHLKNNEDFTLQKTLKEITFCGDYRIRTDDPLLAKQML